MRAAVLTYHSHNISGTAYETNDHVALAADLEALHRARCQIVPLREIAELVRSRALDGTGELRVGMSCDDGPLFDYEDFVHPQFGPQKSFRRLLEEFRERHGAAAQPRLHATSFVIASPAVRAALEADPGCGFPFLHGWLGDGWWAPAAASGLQDIGNHSWDHVHHAAPAVAAAVDARDDFTLVRSYVDADAEIRRAAAFINGRVGGRCTLFAYPFGHTNEYLVEEYFPQRRSEHGMVAAFGATGGAIGAETSLWNIPRAVCGEHWRSSDELLALLAP